jgi:hypothetical protein
LKNQLYEGIQCLEKKLDALSEDKKSNKPLYIDLIRITIILFLRKELVALSTKEKALHEIEQKKLFESHSGSKTNDKIM